MKPCLLFFITCLFSSTLFSATPIIEADITLNRVAQAPRATPTLKTLLIICDNYLTPENNKIAQGVRTDLATVNLFLNTLANRGIARVEKQVLQGRQATQANIVASLKSMQTAPDDIILVYFSGHGGMASGKSFLFTADEKNLMRADVQALANAKPSRLKMIVTDACNNETEGMTASRSLSRGAASAMEGKFDAVYKELLYKYQGMLHLSASSEGQYAWSDDNLGGYFTHYFFKEGLIKNPSANWEAIFKMARDKTSQMFQRLPTEQKRELASDGVNDQTAKAYALPKASAAITVAPATNISAAPIVIWNATQKNVAFFLDKNTDMNQWVPAKLEKKQVASEASLQFKGPKVTIGFTNGKEEIYYDLESGNYFFDYNEFNQLDLFLEEEGVEREEVSRKDYAKLMIGKWEYLDENESIQMSFSSNGTFVEKSQDGQVLIEGKWEVSKLEDEESKTVYPVMIFSQQEDGAQVDLHYLIQTDNGIVQLIYFAAYVDGQYVEEEEADESDDSESVILLYKPR